MKTHFKITRRLLEHVRTDIRRPHTFAAERVGFIVCRFGSASGRTLLVLAHSYQSVADRDYIDDVNYGSVINSDAFRKAMQMAYTHAVGLFHVHLHEHSGRPSPSDIDVRETNKFVPDFFHVRPSLPHGALVVSADSISGRVWLPKDRRPSIIDRFSIVGAPLCTIVESR